ncbi:MAG: D-alanyl-D-alanine carboxypeptidase [Clostridiales bacterium]|nr:D-alanyl-D-alanine carboxypeptidase [Clostridiales bacterium]
MGKLRAAAARLLWILVIPLIITVSTGPLRADIDGDIRAGSYVLMDADTGQVLLEREMHARRKPASITKIMTALLALEKGPADDPVTVSYAAVAANPRDGSSAGLMPGEVIPLDEILYAVMLESANEAANAVAEYVGGTMEEFARMMTERAAGLGAKNTHFANANGLNDDDHYTSVYDMALITREAIKEERFLTIWGAYQHFLEPTNLQAQRRILNNKNRMLAQGALPYKGLLGGKTGYTNASQNTLVEAARRDGRTLICVLMMGPGALANFQDAAMLLDYGFEEFRQVGYENEEYEVSYTFLLHNDLSYDDVRVTLGPPSVNGDGSKSAAVAIALPPSRGDLMYTDIASMVLTTPVPPPEPEEGDAPLAPSVWERAPLRWLAALFTAIAGVFGVILKLIDLLPGWLALIVKVILGAFAALFTAACFFRTRRWIRRRRRRLRRQRIEARRRAFNAEQSYWS